MKKLIEMKNHYKDSEKELHDRMDPHLQRVLGTKTILLFKALLQDMQYPDDKLADEMSAGFPLYGWLPGSGVFSGHVKPPELHPSALDKMAASFSKRAAASVKSSGDADHDLALWEATMSEVREGFVTGPYDECAVPKGALIVPRFGLQQKQNFDQQDCNKCLHKNKAIAYGKTSASKTNSFWPGAPHLTTVHWSKISPKNLTGFPW